MNYSYGSHQPILDSYVVVSFVGSYLLYIKAQEKGHPRAVVAILMGFKSRKMKCGRIQILALVSLMLLFPAIDGWGIDGHYIVCTIAQVFNHPLSLSLSCLSFLSAIFMLFLYLCVEMDSHA